MQTRKTSFDIIREFLSDSKGRPKKTFSSGGTIEAYVSARHISKGSTIARNLREMAEEGELETRYEKVNGRKYVLYRLRNKQ